MKFRKKPVVIEAVQYWPGKLPFVVCMCGHDDKPHLHTIHKNQRVNLEPGDWVIQEPDGIHFYPCKPDIFEATYEKAE